MSSETFHVRYYTEDLFICKQYTTHIYIFLYTCILYYTNIYILIKKSVNTILFFTYIYGNYIAWSFDVKESDDEW